MEPDEYRGWDSAYLLGALTATERREYEEHFATCRDCGDAVRDLARLPATPSTGRVRRRRRRVIVGVVAVAVASVLVLGTALGSVLPVGLASSGSLSTATAMDAVATPATMTAQLVVTAAPWGTRFAWSCGYGSDFNATVDAPSGFSFVVTDREGNVTTIATWTATGSGANGLAGSIALARSDIASVDIRPTGSSTPLVQTRF